MLWTLSLYPPSPSPAAAPLVTHARFSGLLSYATSTGTVTVTVRVAAVAAAMVDTTPPPPPKTAQLPNLPTSISSHWNHELHKNILFSSNWSQSVKSMFAHLHFFFKCQECWRKKYMYVLKHKVQFQR